MTLPPDMENPRNQLKVSSEKFPLYVNEFEFRHNRNDPGKFRNGDQGALKESGAIDSSHFLDCFLST